MRDYDVEYIHIPIAKQRTRANDAFGVALGRCCMGGAGRGGICDARPGLADAAPRHGGEMQRHGASGADAAPAQGQVEAGADAAQEQGRCCAMAGSRGRDACLSWGGANVDAGAGPNRDRRGAACPRSGCAGR
jgi:hypothetical protein